jgi:hypothetical protein
MILLPNMPLTTVATSVSEWTSLHSLTLVATAGEVPASAFA